MNVADASNLERNLYLTTQILETGIPMLLVLNMMDVAHRRGIRIDVQKMSELLGGIPVLTTTASKREGLEPLKQAIADMVQPLFHGQHNGRA